MTKDEVIRRIAAESGESVRDCRKWMGIITEGINRCIIDDDHVVISGFGTFTHKQPAKRPLAFGKENNAPSRIKIKFIPATHTATAVGEGLTSEEAAYRKEIVKALQRGEHVPGYRLLYRDQIERVEEIDPLAPKG